MKNRLAKEKSPYLLQHADNPVDWYPWGEEAFARAKEEDRPIFLSIGYSTCHWCHVMERESFEDETIATYLNANFISIKVDREERPDVDQIYMAAVQRLSGGSGGWPLSVFLTPDGKPFYGGTYFPPVGRMGMPGFLDVLRRVVHLWGMKREAIRRDAETLATLVKEVTAGTLEGEISGEILKRAHAELRRTHDPRHGGFGGAPKFPPSMNLYFLLRYARRHEEAKDALPMVEKTLEMMHRGGMYDHLGGGFHRYSTDHRWLVPHFEKMLYDNALIARCYLEAYQVTRKESHADVAREILDYVLREMTHPGGGFYSAEDADSEGAEGKFYVWTPDELEAILGKETGAIVGRYYGVSESGNFEHGTSILHLPVPPDDFIQAEGLDPIEWRKTLAGARAALLEARSKRIRPHRDDKIITSWNGLMISTMAFAAAVLGEERYEKAAVSAADFILGNLVRDGRLLRRHREEADIPGYVDDYAFLVMGLLDLYETTLDARHFQSGMQLTEDMVRLFHDPQGKGFFFVGSDGPELIARTKEIYDGAIPSGNSVAAMNLLRLAEWTGDARWQDLGKGTLEAFGQNLQQIPRAYPQALCAVDFLLDTPKEIVLAGERGSPDLEALLETIRGRFLPNRVIALVSEGLLETVPMLKDRGLLDGKAAAYVCESYACKLPTGDPETLGKLLDE
jgi:uncharacterized protein YyaL (SSP411 family)